MEIERISSYRELKKKEEREITEYTAVEQIIKEYF